MLKSFSFIALSVFCLSVSSSLFAAPPPEVCARNPNHPGCPVEPVKTDVYEK